MFTVASTGTLHRVAGSPFATGSGPASAAFSGNGRLVAVANIFDSTVSVFSVGQTGALTAIQGSPFAGASFPTSVAFSSGRELLATANAGDNTTSVFSVRPAAH